MSNNPSSREVIEQFKRLYTRMRDDYNALKSDHEKVLTELRTHKEALAMMAQSASVTTPNETEHEAPSASVTTTDNSATEHEAPSEDANGINIPHNTPQREVDTDDEDEGEGDNESERLAWMKDVDEALVGWVH